MQSECVRLDCRMLRGNLVLFLALLLMGGTLSSGESEAGRGTGIEGVVSFSPTRAGPVEAGNDHSGCNDHTKQIELS
jgi:hypothetical protein